MKNKHLLFAWLAGICLLFPHLAVAEIIYPITSKTELQSLVRELNTQKIKMTDWYNDDDINPGVDRTFEKVDYVDDNGEFFIKGCLAGFKFFKTDINNDGEDKLVKTEERGQGRIFAIDAVYKNVKRKWIDISNEIDKPLHEALDKAKGVKVTDSPQPEDDFGDLIIEKKDGKVYFTIIEGIDKRGWEVLKTFDASDEPIAYEFLWVGSKLQFIRTYQRLLKKSDIFKGQ